jgi:hypothetical protein
LTSILWAHVRPYGEVKLNMTRRLALKPYSQDNAETSNRTAEGRYLSTRRRLGARAKDERVSQPTLS